MIPIIDKITPAIGSFSPMIIWGGGMCRKFSAPLPPPAEYDVPWPLRRGLT